MVVKNTVTRLNNSNLLGLTENNIEKTCDAINNFLFTFENTPLNETKGELLVLPYQKGENPAKWLKVIVRAKKKQFQESKIEFALSIFLLSKTEFDHCQMLQIGLN